MVFKIQERVMAKWPGSNLWFEGTVVDFNDIEYQIKFDDEGQSEYVLKYRDVKSIEAFQRSRSRSRGRSKSRGRSVGRRSKASEKEEVVEKKVEKVETQNAKDKTKAEPVKESPKSVPKADVISPRTSTPARQSMRIAAMQESKNAFDGQVNNVHAAKLKTGDVTGKGEPPNGIGSRICGGLSCIGSCIKAGVLMLIPSFATIKAVPIILLLLALPLVLNRMCTKNKCTIMEVPDIPTKLAYYYDLTAVSIVGSFLLLLLLLSLIPVGRKVNLPNGAVLRCNGYISVLASLILIPALMYFEYNVLVVYKLYQQLLATFIVLTVVISLLLYIRARNIPNDAKNPAGNSGHILPDLLHGRELNPAIGSLDLKLYLLRAMAIMILLLNIIIVIKDLEANKGQYSPTLLVACILQIFSAVDMVWFEEAVTTTYLYKQSGCGLIVVSLGLQTPFTATIVSRIVLNHRTELEWYFLTLITALNLVGYTIFRGSLSQKHAFRTNPSDPALAHLESLPTSAGTRLLVTGWWGFVRHPNYLGDMIITISWGLVCGFKLAMPWILVGLNAVYWIGRILEVEGDCKKKYGTAWSSYIGRVKHRLIPKVF